MTQTVGMVLDSRGERGRDALRALAAALPEAGIGEPDDVGAFDITFEASTFEDGLARVWDAVAAAGVDDHVRFREHPDLPEHFRARRGGTRPG